MKPRLPILLALVPALASCTPWVDRGRFWLVSPTSNNSAYSVLSKTRLVGEACFGAKAAMGGGDDVYHRATAEALAQFPGAELLVDVAMEDKGSCVEVSGLPAKAFPRTPNKSLKRTP